MIFKKYDSYKDSGLEWLGDIPSEWEVKRIKDYTKTFSGTTPLSNNSQYYDGKIYWIRTTDLNNKELYESEFKVTDKAFNDYSLKLLPLNSILVAMYGGIGTIGKNSILKTKATLNQSVCSILPNKYRYYSKFLLYFMQYFRYKWIIFANSSRKDPNINQDAILNLFTIIPPLKIQTKIANYLDTQTQKIDKEIELLEKKSLKYKELKQTLINETVLRGLDKGVKFETKRLKDFIVYTIGGEVIDVGYWGRGSELTYTAGKNPLLSDFDKFPDRKRTKQNDILIARNGDGFVHIPKLNSIFTNVVQLVRLNKKVNINFIWYCLENIKFNINRTSNGDFIASLNKEMWFNSFLNIPPLKEQIKIATYLNEKTQKIDAITKTITTKITLLKEFRKTLINDTVTGKIKL